MTIRRGHEIMNNLSGKCLLLVLLTVVTAFSASLGMGGTETLLSRQTDVGTPTPGKTSSEEKQTRRIIDFRKTEERDGLVYEIGSDTPYTGTVVSTPMYLTTCIGPDPLDEVPDWTWESWNDCPVKESEIHYLDGKYHGKYIGWSSNRKNIEAEFSRGELHGLTVGWWENGQKAVEERWHHGKRHGIFTCWYESGQIWQKGEYAQGELVREICWDKFGNPIECEFLQDTFYDLWLVVSQRLICRISQLVL